ncbi:hypothetical protein BD779DRAFT_1785833 [Infundibulicybe gibba]|nr:hypothetical protein BD779DRAFT_1785833 [Infundibulicybe gibba]
MQLFLSEQDPLNATYTNEIARRYTRKPAATICRIVPSGIRNSTSASLTSSRDQFGHLARVKWHNPNSSTIRMSGEEIKTEDFFRKVGWGRCIGRSRIFTAPDGKEYKWKIGMGSSTLRANDSTKTRIAKYHPGNYIINRRPASLEISPAGEHIVDVILVTFIYIEMIRQDEARSAISGQ